MREFSKEVLHMADKIANAERIVIYGAKLTAQEILPVCESLAGQDKIAVVVTHLRKEDPQFLDHYPIREVDCFEFTKQTLVLAAMSERFFPEIAQMPQIQTAGCVLYATLAVAAELKRYAAVQSLKRLGIDLRLFDRLYSSDIFEKSDISSSACPSVTEKMWELAAEETARYVTRHMRNALVFSNRETYHAWLKEQIDASQTETGVNLEFGVADGATLQKFAGDAVNPFYGFDSFEGLPEDWFSASSGGGLRKVPLRKGSLCKGAFRQECLPWVPPNTELVKGWFEDTLPLFTARADMQGKTADFIHIDCDLYTSTKTIFNHMDSLIRKGTIIAFDEYINYPGWQMDEFKAFQEYVAARGISYAYLAYVERNTQACVRIL